MRTWVYSWKSSDGLRHEGEMGAPNKDAVYDALRERGIRAIKVTERIQPIVRRGFRGLRKRDWTLILLAVVFAALVLTALAIGLSGRRSRPVVTDEKQVERIAPDRASREALMQLVKERKANEEACRQKLIRRVEAGTLSKEVANEIFLSMGLKKID